MTTEVFYLVYVSGLAIGGCAALGWCRGEVWWWVVALAGAAALGITLVVTGWGPQ